MPGGKRWTSCSKQVADVRLSGLNEYSPPWTLCRLFLEEYHTQAKLICLPILKRGIPPVRAQTGGRHRSYRGVGIDLNDRDRVIGEGSPIRLQKERLLCRRRKNSLVHDR